MNAVIFGAGKIARGFIAHLLHLGGISPTFVESNQALVDLLNRQGRYHIEVMGNKGRASRFPASRRFRWRTTERWRKPGRRLRWRSRAWAGKIWRRWAKHLAEVIQLRSAVTRETTNLITCENWKEPAALLREKIEGQLPPDTARSVLRSFGFSEAVVMRSAIEPTAEQKERDPLWVNVQDFGNCRWIARESWDSRWR